MIRLVGILVGLGFAFVALISFAFGIGPAFSVLSEHGHFVEPTAEHEFHLEAREPEGGFAFEGPVGKWDVAQLQRGFQVYKEVCSACHSLNQVAFRDLTQLGYSEAQVKAEALTWNVPGIDPDTGEDVMRPALPTDYFPKPYANAIAAAAANRNAIPPDLSLMTKARHDGTHYVYSLLTGYRDPATFGLTSGETLREEFPEFETPEGLHFNPYFPNLNLAMAAPLSANAVTYADGTEASVDQMAQDVAAFLTWTAEPTLVKRKQTGWWIMLFTLFVTVLAWFAKKQVWAPVKPHRRKD
ncbi:cytochrome c1 [Aurantiacibacter luteus]|uniref:Cytochrome c1 n=1 Tax=Aurantiacibacter luteus TaxID=1581420 RepID=A0A0G9MUJ3_9SPHN|nr:cytochrome c1 [Aurantiacibacter luteus]KLE34397.1 cytochrome C [Aurantiacibacter luteus]